MPHSLTVAMMSRITLHPKRFAHGSTTIHSDMAHRHVPRRLPPFATRPHVPPRRVRGTPSLETPPRVAFPPRWFTSARTPPGTVPEGESFALESFSAAPPPEPSSGRGTSVTDDPAPPVTIDLDLMYSVGTVGDEELAGSRGSV